MANPITWQNITGPSMADAAKPMAMAQLSLDNAFSKFSGVIADREKNDLANWNQQKTNNQNEYLNTVAGFKTEEELRAAQRSGVLQQMLQGYGAQIDHTAVRGAVNEQIANLQRQWQANTTHQDAVTAFNQRDVRDRITATAVNNPAEAKVMIAANPDLVDQTGLAETVKKSVDAQITAKRAAETHASTQASAELNRGVTAQTLENTRYTQEQTVADREAADVAAGAALSAADRVNKNTIAYGKVAKENGMPVNEFGVVEWESLTPQQKVNLNAAGVAAGLDPYTAATSLSVAAASETPGVMASGMTSSRALAAVPQVAAGAPSALGATPTGASRAKAAAIDTLKEEDAKARGVYDFDTSKAVDINAENMKDYLSHIPEDKRGLVMRGVSEYLRKGYLLENGQTMQYPVGAVKAAMLEANNGWIGSWNNYMDHVKTFLDKNMTNPANIEKMAEAETFRTKKLGKLGDSVDIAKLLLADAEAKKEKENKKARKAILNTSVDTSKMGGGF